MSSAPARSPQHARAIGFLVLATALWGLSFPLGKAIMSGQEALYPDASRWFFTAQPVASRFLLAAALLLVFFRGAVLQLGPREWRHGAMLALFCGGGLLLQFTGLQLVEASVSAFITQLAVAFVPLLVALDKRRWPGRRVWLALALMLVGAAILVELDLRAFHLGTGELLTLGGAAFFAGQVYWLERDDVRGVRPLAMTFAMFLVLGAAFALLALATAPVPAALWEPLAEPAVLAPLLGLTVCCTFVSFTLMNRWQPLVTATEAGLIYSAESVWAAGFALFLPGLLVAAFGGSYGNEHLKATLLLGGALIIFANLMVQLGPWFEARRAAWR